jgi:hypothetical protein
LNHMLPMGKSLINVHDEMIMNLCYDMLMEG